MKKVFISYARTDLASAQKIYEYLKNDKEIDPWFDKVSILGGTKWKREVRAAIRDCDYFLSINSSNSIKGRGARHNELHQALEILKDFPDGERFVIPIRLDNCEMPRDELYDISWIDMFENFEAGLNEVVRAIKGNQPEAASIHPQRSLFSYHYRVALLDLNHNVGSMSQLASELNQVQQIFYFTNPAIEILEDILVNIDQIDNFATFLLPHAVYEKHGMLNADIAMLMTTYPLAFRENGTLYYNYHSGPSTVDERFIFLSLNHLYQFAKVAKCSFEQAIVTLIVSQLVIFFTDAEFHQETRGCTMDHCENRHDLVLSLAKRSFCEICWSKIGVNPLTEALVALLKWNPRQ